MGWSCVFVALFHHFPLSEATKFTSFGGYYISDSSAQTDELLLPPVMQRCNAGFRLEELAHEAAVGEFQAVSNL